MATFARHADVDWTGTLMEGNGTAKAGTGAFSLPVTFPSRIASTGDDKTTPEELLAASHAVCYAMVLTNVIGKQGGKARRVRVTATVQPGQVFVPFHYIEACANNLTVAEFDPISREPNYKQCAVQVEKIGI